MEVVDVYCEEGGPTVKIHVKLPQNGSIKQFDRPRDQSLQKTLHRISLTLKKGPKKKGRGKFQQSWSEEKVKNESEPELGLFDEQGQQIDDVPLADAFTLKRAPTLLKLGGRQYRVRLNRPMVKGITCRGRPMAGHRLVPMGSTASWNTEDLSRLRWEWRSSGKLLAKTRCFTPTEAEVGQNLEVIARPPLATDERMGFLLGLDDEEAAARLVFDVVLEAPLSPSLAKERNQEMQRQLQDSCKDGDQFRVTATICWLIHTGTSGTTSSLTVNLKPYDQKIDSSCVAKRLIPSMQTFLLCKKWTLFGTRSIGNHSLKQMATLAALHKRHQILERAVYCCSERRLSSFWS